MTDSPVYTLAAVESQVLLHWVAGLEWQTEKAVEWEREQLVASEVQASMAYSQRIQRQSMDHCLLQSLEQEEVGPLPLHWLLSVPKLGRSTYKRDIKSAESFIPTVFIFVVSSQQ